MGIRVKIGNIDIRNVGGLNWAAYWTAPTEKSYALLDSTVNGKYNTHSCMAHHPRLMNKVILTYLEKAAHIATYPGILKMRISNDNALTFAVATTIYDPGVGRVLMDNFNGYSSNGRLHILTTVVDETTYANCQLIYNYSDNNGVSFITTDITSIITDATRDLFRITSKLIENNGVLIAGAFRWKGDLSTSERMCLRLVNGIWTAESVEITVAYENEIAFERLGGDNLIALTREEVTPYDYVQYSSDDNGLTWTRLGIVNFGLVNTRVGYSPILCRFKMNGEYIIVCYFTHPPYPGEKIYAVYAKASDLLEMGAGGWNYSTLKTILTSPDGYVYKQGDFLHYDNNYNARGSTLKHYYVSPTQADLILFEVDTTDLDTLIAKLFPSYSADADSDAFNAVVNTNPTAVVNLIGGLKQYSIYTKIKAAYPMLGGTAALHKFNLVNPADSDAAFRLDFVDGAGTGWIHSATGAKPDGVGTYADTHLVPENILALYSASLGYYSRTNIAEARWDIGASLSTANKLPSLGLRLNPGDIYTWFYAYSATGLWVNDYVIGVATPIRVGLSVGSRSSNVLNKLFYKGIQSGATNTNVAGDIQPNIPIYIAARNYAGAAQLFSTKECAFATIADGLTDNDVHNLNRVVHYFQKALGRNV